MIHIECDHCGADLSKPTPFPDYKLTLTCDRLPNTDVVFTVAILPPINRTGHFCGIQCLKNWLANQK